MNDLIRWAEGIDVALPSGFFGSLDACNAMLHPSEQAAILEAAWCAHNHRDFQAEQARSYAHYGYHDRKADRARRGLRSLP